MHRAPSHFVVKIPDGLDPAVAAPMLVSDLLGRFRILLLTPMGCTVRRSDCLLAPRSVRRWNDRQGRRYHRHRRSREFAPFAEDEDSP